MKRVEVAAKPCENCGTCMSRKRYGAVLEDLTAFSKRRFCSLSCANTRKTLTKHGYSWRARKHLKALCEACGTDQQLQAHHIDQDKRNNEPTNIQTLCRWCHDFHHATAKRLGLAVAGRMASLGLPSGFPLGWTALEPSEMPSSRSRRTRSLPKSPESSEPEPVYERDPYNGSEDPNE
jgi:hypothetical protein